MTKQEHWISRHHDLLPVITPASDDDVFQSLLRQVQRDYVRLSDAETLKLARACWEGTPAEAAFARDMLGRNAAPVALKMAFNYSTRFGGLLEAWDGALWQLNKLFPHITGGEKPRRTGWNGEMAGIRWLCWVQLKLAAELPSAAERLVDEKRAPGAPAAIASARSRLLTTTGNDAELYDWLFQRLDKLQYGKRLPKGRKNLLVKRGIARYTRKVLVKSLPCLTAGLAGKPQLAVSLSGKMVALPSAKWTNHVPQPEVRVLPIVPRFIAAAVRANARIILRRPKLAERTRIDAERLSKVTELWVTTNAKSHRLDALVGNDQDERLADIIAAEVSDEKRFEAPLHRADQVRALSAYKRFGPIYGEALTKLPVRQLLPIQKTRVRERAVRQSFAAFCQRAGQPELGHVMVAAARQAAKLAGLTPDSSAGEIRDALSGVQDALRGRKPVKGRVGALGQALQVALEGQRLQPVSVSDQQIAVGLKKAFPTLKFNFSLAAAYVFGRKLDKQGKADKAFVEACRKAGLRLKIAEEALELVKDLPLAQPSGCRIRVTNAKGYVRPWQLALEAQALSIGDKADAARKAYLNIRAEQPLEEEIEALNAEQWLMALDTMQEASSRLAVAAKVSETLTAAAADLEESCADLNMARALNALIAVDEILDDHMSIQNTEAWWADAYWALDQRPAELGKVLFDAEVPF